MPAHYIYEGTPDARTLCQGDLLRRTDHLVERIREHFPYYADHADYRYFLVITQSCDLYRRGGGRCGADYLSLAAVRSIDDAIRLEAAKGQEDWQAATNVISTRLKSRLTMFLERVIDNNEPGYFYLHQDPTLGIQPECCAFLPLSISLRAAHYDLCLGAKAAQLTETFQAKLGWLLGHMYSRVGTSEWNQHYSDRKVSTTANGYLNRNFVTVDDKQIDEGIAELKAQAPLEGKTHEEIKEYILQKKVIPRKDRFQARALDLLKGTLKPIEQVRKRVVRPLRTDGPTREAIGAILLGAGVPPEQLEGCRDGVIGKVMDKLTGLLSDEAMPGKDDFLLAIIRGLLQDAQITNIMK